MDKLQERRNKLAAWKQKRAQGTKKPGLKLALNKVAKEPKKIVRNSAGFESDEEAPKRKMFKPGQETEDVAVSQDEEDTLDMYMANLQDDSVETDGVMVDDEFESDANDANDTVSSRKRIKKRVRAVEHADLEPIIKEFAIANGFAEWSQLALPQTTLDHLIHRFEKPTQVQLESVPLIMSGNDLLAVSKTGSGKTLAYLLPMLRHCAANKRENSGPISLILAPTRELAVQIHQECLKLPSPLRFICCVGGSELKSQINDLKTGSVDVIIATPGRMIDLLTLNNGRLLKTQNLSYIVMDEADRLFDLGFEPQVRQIMKVVRRDRQCVLFSATFPSKLRAFASKTLLPNRKIVKVASQEVVNENITQLARVFDNDDAKFKCLLQQLGRNDEKVIVFAASQQICDTLEYKLKQFGYETISIHAGKTASERTSNLQKYKSHGRILLCTEVLSRGLDVPEVTLVVIYDAVKTFAQYIHTTGRTGRGDRKGTALTLLLNDDLVQAYIVDECIPMETKMTLPDCDKIQAMANEFAEGLKTGKYRITKGFGGKGLDNYEHEEEQDSQDDLEVSEVELQVEYSSTELPDSSAVYTGKIIIDDLPQQVRWNATKRETMEQVIQRTSVSVEIKGTYHTDDKLTLVIQSSDQQSVREATQMFESRIKQELAKEQESSTKFTL